jgi:hypothetical protein
MVDSMPTTVAMRARAGSIPPGQSPGNPLVPTRAPQPEPDPPVEHSDILGEHVSVARGPQHPLGLHTDAYSPYLALEPVQEDRLCWLVGVHGGAGVSTLAVLLDDHLVAERDTDAGGRDGDAGGRDGDVDGHGEVGETVGELRDFPYPQWDRAAPPRVVLVAWTHAWGLHRAAAALEQWHSGDTRTTLLGLVLVGDGPRKLPDGLARQVTRLRDGTAPRLWHLPYTDRLRTVVTIPEVAELPHSERARKTLREIAARARAARQQATPVPAVAGGVEVPGGTAAGQAKRNTTTRR